MKTFSRTQALLRSLQRVTSLPRTHPGGPTVNHGLLSNTERGDSFTEPEVYRSKHNITAQMKTRQKVKRMQQEEHNRNTMNALGVDTVTEEELQSGRRLSLRRNEVAAARHHDAQIAEAASSTTDYSSDLHRAMQWEAERRDRMMDRYAQPPTSREFYTLFRRLRESDDDEERIEAYQRRLVEEHGVYPTSRVDAFMLDDDSFFPDWVQALPHSIRDRVKFGSLGLTEEDEAMRVRLGRLPRDKRVAEWRRLKHAKEYRAAHEETLTLAQIRDARQGKRRFHWLQRKRQKRASQLRRMAMRKPEGYEEWPSTAVDYSQRVAFVAQHVENGVVTNGQWPLDPNELARAKLRRQKDEAERTFLLSAEEKKMTRSSSMHGGIKELLHSFENPQRPFKQLSRKEYANRVNAIVHGDQDEYGHKYREMLSRSSHRMRPYDSLEEMGLEKEVRKEPQIHTKGLRRTDDENWTRHHKSWSDGMPSKRYGS